MYKKPLLALLKGSSPEKKIDKRTADAYGERIRKCLNSLKVDVELVESTVSPINMVFDFKLVSETSFKMVESLANDISLAVGRPVKIFSRGESSGVFSVSVLRGDRDYFGIGEMLSSNEYKSSASPLTMCAGIDELAKNIVFDLAEAPHLLISGTTGSGKTVFLDDLILSILYKTSPAKVKLVLIDPSVDMNIYEGVPHLLFRPVSKKWDVYEVLDYIRNRMNKRFDRLAKAGVRNVEQYNQEHKTQIPRIVVVIDKFLEYTYEMPEGFEECVDEIARKGRAAGVHLIINSQTARSEVVSNSIKANIPYRVAFTVTDWHESKAILDKTGAQKLTGGGEMLFLPGFNAVPLHIQAPYVTLKEVEEVVSCLKNRNKPVEYKRDLNAEREPIEDNIAYVIDILDAISEMRSVDVYSVQKIMNVDFAEASDIISFLEEQRAISNYGGKGRTVDIAVVEKLLKDYRNELSQIEE